MMFFFSWLFLYIFVLIEGVIIRDRTLDTSPEISATKQAAYVCGVVIVYALFIVISFVTRHVTGDLIFLMIVFVFIFTFGVCITVMFFKQLMGPFRNLGKKRPRISQKNNQADDVKQEGAANIAYDTESF